MRISSVLLAAAVSAAPTKSVAGTGGDSPITAGLLPKKGFATFTNRLHPNNRIGYRFHEHTPIVHGRVPTSDQQAGIDPAQVAGRQRDFSGRSGAVKYTLPVRGKGWVDQHWTFYLAPVADGIDLLLVVEAGKTGLNDYYGIQQCFRMSGKTNQQWRRAIAETPAFSEYDRWNSTQENDAGKTSLTCVLRGGAWAALPATPEAVGARTPIGLRFDTDRTRGRIETMPKVGPYDAHMLDPIDCGLIARTNREKTWVCGIFWERTSHVTDHHPADCLHAIVNIGGIPPGSKRAVRGKIYWFKGTLDNLRNRWQRDFISKDP